MKTPHFFCFIFLEKLNKKCLSVKIAQRSMHLINPYGDPLMPHRIVQASLTLVAFLNTTLQEII